ncbi:MULTISPECIES: LexA family protein [Wohlfahrtiimonas]|uniref:LexA family protein n=1 Tax=Wohlfahrtiimonas TaxID=582472 RepID=UPI000B9819FD|nr:MULTISPECIES: XRE family transcriptional regulator [Wohlfahrtiimonas]MBS7815893.1 helix-turn-helix domain-containing protein [Wohlfahrtiimonas chitiniclastica]MBS7822112.1 helix-turn-helix domain-containing protein [Wohlfahrtiimonas chitiniclastica]MBS7829904.1 helix-turn-helix domain-containing protein [Wohlfahrtiimonas chitiniclastica]MBS7831871.1 helix-turn-helix domain-containing protein [Wohlfahrtiimonas chitiniclastica]MBS7835203.1 helix-turn-helix domain-containing protein [Wohlfahrt
MLKDRLYQARKAKRYSREALAEKAGVSTSTITFLENGRNESSKFLVEIANALDVSAEWLKGENVKDVTATPKLDSSLSEAPDIKGMIPVISWVAAGSWCNIESLLPDDAIRWLPCPVGHSKNTYALRVSGISMYNPNGKPSFEDGDIIFVDPEKSAENKSCVVVRLDDDITATFKQLIIENGEKYLQPLNPNWPDKIIKVNGNATICGVVIGKWVDM